MLKQWLFIICSLLFVSNSDAKNPIESSAVSTESRDITRVVQANAYYGWQVSGSSVAALDVPAQ